MRELDKVLFDITVQDHSDYWRMLLGEKVTEELISEAHALANEHKESIRLGTPRRLRSPQ
jgi:hypothetical protein